MITVECYFGKSKSGSNKVVIPPVRPKTLRLKLDTQDPILRLIDSPEVASWFRSVTKGDKWPDNWFDCQEGEVGDWVYERGRNAYYLTVYKGLSGKVRLSDLRKPIGSAEIRIVVIFDEDDSNSDESDG